jgi:ABC-type Fe3+ transport system substrate-binding protein
MIDPLKPLMILPEVTDGANWRRGALWFMDPEEQYVLRLFNTIQSSIFYNGDKVKPAEMRTAQDLLNPKWRGKIVTDPPTNATGTGGNQAANIYSQLGPAFFKKLYVDQKPVFSGDRRQFTDWLARGTQFICLTCRNDDITPLQKDGFNIQQVYGLEGFKNRLSSSPFLLSVANKAPNPNAMRVFVNWMATKEALDIYAKSYGAAALRKDTDVSHLDPRLIPPDDVTYPDDSDPKWRSVEKVEISAKIKEILKGTE